MRSRRWKHRYEISAVESITYTYDCTTVSSFSEFGQSLAFFAVIEEDLGICADTSEFLSRGRILHVLYEFRMGLDCLNILGESNINALVIEVLSYLDVLEWNTLVENNGIVISSGSCTEGPLVADSNRVNGLLEH